jgi:hypothetical protein
VNPRHIAGRHGANRRDPMGETQPIRNQDGWRCEPTLTSPPSFALQVAGGCEGIDPGSDLRESLIIADLVSGLAWGLDAGASWQGSRHAPKAA